MSNPAVVFGGPSPEHDVSILTGLQFALALAKSGRDPHAIYWSKSGTWHLVSVDSEAADFVDGPPKKARDLSFDVSPSGGFVLKKRSLEISVVANCCHGGPGEDGTLQGLFDICGFRYTGPNAASAAIGMDKFAFGAIVEASGLSSLPRVAALGDVAGELPFDAPYIVKPRFGGSSIGIEIVEDLETAKVILRSSVHMREGAVIEPYIADSSDLSIAIRTWPEVALSAIERPIRGGSSSGLFDYSEKYLSGRGLAGAERELPASLSPESEAQVRRAAEVVARVLPVRSMHRLDFIERTGEIWVNEINTIPGAMAGYLWVDPPVSYEQLVTDMIDEADSWQPKGFSTAGSDGTLLRSSGSIAGKLG